MNDAYASGLFDGEVTVVCIYVGSNSKSGKTYRAIGA
jgi:hypothetical protein